MARGTALSVLRQMLKAELGDYSAANSARDSELNQLLSNKQLQLVHEVEWAFLVRRWEVSVPAGQQFTAFPTTEIDNGTTCNISLDHILLVEVLDGSLWQPVLYGIGEEQYNTYDFEHDTSAKADPVTRWRVSTNATDTAANKFEVWPVPETTQTMRFTGQRVVGALAADTDKAELDDMLLVLGVACDKLLRTQQADAQSKTVQFQRLLQRLRARNFTKHVRRSMVGCEYDEEPRRLVGMQIVS